MNDCTVPYCDSPVRARGWCGKHYQRWRATGDPLGTRPGRWSDMTPEDRFWSHLPDRGSDGCWEWMAHRGPLGYGRCKTSLSRSGAAHIIAYELLVGPVPDGMELDHLCRNPPCCNPGHLEPVTHAENLRRGVKGGWAAENAAKTQCKRGHSLSGDNLRIESTGSRRCRTCGLDATRRYKARQKLKR